jgi:predicted Zn-dependent protease
MAGSRSLVVCGLIVCAGLGLAGCATVSETGRSQLLMTSVQQEADMGLQAWQEVIKTEKPCQDQAKVAAVDRVGRALSAVITESGFEWEFRTFESEQANAFCLPGGKVAVYSGLFQYLASDAELAAVVGHEIAHAVARHGGERISQAMLMEIGKQGISVALGSRAPAAQARYMTAYAGLAQYGVLLPYSRKHEYEADNLGLRYMARAGYDPQAAVDFWQKFGAESPGGAIGEFMSTHPSGPHRIAQLQQLLPEARAQYGRAPTPLGRGQVYGKAGAAAK